MNTSLEADPSALGYLIVDDEAFIRGLIERILRKMGAQRVEAATGGQLALDALDRGATPDIILCDLNMPGMDGIEFLRHLVNRGFAGGVALISGEDKRILETVARLGMAQNLNILGSLSKPITPNALADLVARFDATRRATQKRRDAAAVDPEHLRTAIGEGRITVHYQPKVSVETRALVGVEALARWIDPALGFVPPDAFIPVAEEQGLIDDLTLSVLTQALAQGALWRSQGLDIKVAVNLSVNNLHRLDFPEFIMALAQAKDTAPNRLILELTESRLITDMVRSLEILTRLRLKGLELSIDDFGTGHSSLEQLRRIPFTELKVDRAFVHGATTDDTARSILESAVSLARRLGMTTVAEGVENQEDWDLCARLGVDLIQGYFVCRPLPAPDLDLWRSTWRTEAP
jgi:EAL domain-containing protein (putative c-di-GMP-specific phosphodiesterase class I)/FixJ family two-component response regulator